MLERCQMEEATDKIIKLVMGGAPRAEILNEIFRVARTTEIATLERTAECSIELGRDTVSTSDLLMLAGAFKDELESGLTLDDVDAMFEEFEEMASQIEREPKPSGE